MEVAGTPWTDLENDLTVADYFAMLTNDLATLPYSKAQHRRTLHSQIGRPEGAIEFKHQNISAVLLGLGQPWISGYKPAANFQGSLIDAVLRWLEARPTWLRPSNFQAEAQYADTPMAGLSDNSLLWIGPPPTFSNAPPPIDVAKLAHFASRFDAAGRDARNRDLGRAGEERVLLNERLLLAAAGRYDLAEQVQWTSNADGDAAGFDIQSFESDGRLRLLEVKTTNGWERTPFHISRNECQVAESRADVWHLIRLYDFARTPKAFAIRPPLDRHVELTPTSFLAALH